MSLLNLDDIIGNISSDLLKSNGWQWDSVDHFYVKPIYNFVMTGIHIVRHSYLSREHNLPDILYAAIKPTFDDDKYALQIRGCNQGQYDHMVNIIGYVSDIGEVNTQIHTYISELLEMGVPENQIMYK